MEAQLAKVVPCNFLTPMRIIRDAIQGMGTSAPIFVSKGANTMDVSRSMLIQTKLGTRLDAGTWETIGIGLGYCIAVVMKLPGKLVVTVEGYSMQLVDDSVGTRRRREEEEEEEQRSRKRTEAEDQQLMLRRRALAWATNELPPPSVGNIARPIRILDKANRPRSLRLKLEFQSGAKSAAKPSSPKRILSAHFRSTAKRLTYQNDAVLVS